MNSLLPISQPLVLSWWDVLEPWLSLLGLGPRGLVGFLGFWSGGEFFLSVSIPVWPLFVLEWCFWYWVFRLLVLFFSSLLLSVVYVVAGVWRVLAWTFFVSTDIPSAMERFGVRTMGCVSNVCRALSPWRVIAAICLTLLWATVFCLDFLVGLPRLAGDVTWGALSQLMSVPIVVWVIGAAVWLDHVSPLDGVTIVLVWLAFFERFFRPGFWAWRQVDGFGQPLDESSNVVVARPATLTGHLRPRLRRRAVWVKRLEDGLRLPSSVGQVLRGRWTPDLPSENLPEGLNLILAHRSEGVRLLGGGAVQGKDKGDGGEQLVKGAAYYHVELRDGSIQVVFPELLSELVSYAFLRVREATLVPALRSRARDWAKRRGLSGPATQMAVESAVWWTWELSPREVDARERLSEPPVAPWWG